MNNRFANFIHKFISLGFHCVGSPEKGLKVDRIKDVRER